MDENKNSQQPDVITGEYAITFNHEDDGQYQEQVQHICPHCNTPNDMHAQACTVCGYPLCQNNDTETEPQESPADKHEKPQNNRGRMALYLLAGMLLALLAGFGGAFVAADRIAAKASAQTEAEILAHLDEYIRDAGVSVIYRSVETENSVSDAETYQGIIRHCEDAVVEISTAANTEFYSFFGLVSGLREGAGSGIIVSSDGYILTCAHVIEGTSSIRVTLHNGSTYEAEPVGTNAENDMAVLKIDPKEELNPAVIGDSSQLAVGDRVFAIGNPLGQLGGTVTTGIISALDRELTIQGETFNLLQTDAAINGGNSGGALFNARGELIGMVNAKAANIGVEGLGFALPINDIWQDVEDLINLGYVSSQVSLGVMMVEINDDRTALAYGVEELGVYLLDVHSGSNAEIAGLKRGDRIVEVDGKPVTDSQQVVDCIDSKKVGDEMSLKIIRDDKTLYINAMLYADPQNQNAAITAM